MIRAVKRSLFIPLAALTVSTGGCQSPADNQQMAAFALENSDSPKPPAVLMRLTSRELRFYNFPGLQDAGWSIPRNGLHSGRVIGFAGGSQQLFILSDSVLSAIDVAAGLVRVADSAVRLAVLGPDGVPYVVGTSGSVGVIEQRSLNVWADSAAGRSVAIWGAVGGRLLAETPTPDGRELELFSEHGSPTRVTAPAGPMAVTRWGEVVAVATPNSIVLVDTRDGSTATVDVIEGPANVAFSASGHLLFVTTVTGNLMWFDRFSGTPLGSIPVAGSPGAMRLGISGRFLFLRDAVSDTVTVFDIPRSAVTARLETRWTAVTPSIAPDGTIIVRRGDAMVALDPGSLEVVGRVAGNPGDIWSLAEWRPTRPVAQQVETQPVQAPAGEQEMYVQVSASQNQAWAVDLRDRLNQAGMSASVMDPSGGDDLYRVVLGPFTSREEAELAGRSLGRPYWIFSPADSRENR